MPLQIHNQQLLIMIICFCDCLLLLAIGYILSKSADVFKSRLACLQLILLVVVGALVLYRTPFEASNLAVSDAIEYASAAHRLWFEGEYSLKLAGQTFPPRYLPMFSAFILVPGYALAGAEIGNAVYPIFICAILTLIVSFMIGEKIYPSRGGLLAGLTIMLIPEFRSLATIPMTDVPSCCIALLLALHFIQLRSKQDPANFFDLLAAGILIALACSFRPSNIFLAIGFIALLFDKEDGFQFDLAFGLLVPIFAYAISTAVYNYSVFGDPLRSGYHYWVSIPYDYFSLVFSNQYLPHNLLSLLSNPTAQILLIFLSFLLYLKIFQPYKLLIEILEKPESQAFLSFIFIYTIPTILFFLLYFYFLPWFYLPAGVLLMVLICSTAAGMISKSGYRLLTICLCFLAGLLYFRQIFYPFSPTYRLIAEQLLHTPDNAIIISALNPAYTERLVQNSSQREYLPISRRVEFASKIISPQKIALDTIPSDPLNHRYHELLRLGGREAIERVALEDFSYIRSALRVRRPVYLDKSLLTANELAEMQLHFKLENTELSLLKLELKN